MTNFQQELDEIIEGLSDAWCYGCTHPRCLDNKKSAKEQITSLFLQTIEQSKGKKSGIWAQESWLKGYEEGQHQLHQNIVKNVGGSDGKA